MVDTEQQEILCQFNTLLEKVYTKKLKNFCEEFDIRNLGESFYKKVQKNRNRMSKQKVSEDTLDEFRKYIIFMEAKILEKECSWEEKKALKEFRNFI